MVLGINIFRQRVCVSVCVCLCVSCVCVCEWCSAGLPCFRRPGCLIPDASSDAEVCQVLDLSGSPDGARGVPGRPAHVRGGRESGARGQPLSLSPLRVMSLLLCHSFPCVTLPLLHPASYLTRQTCSMWPNAQNICPPLPILCFSYRPINAGMRGLHVFAFFLQSRN